MLKRAAQEEKRAPRPFRSGSRGSPVGSPRDGESGLQIRQDTSQSLKRLPESAGKCPHARLRLKAALARWTVNTQRQIPQLAPTVLPLQPALRAGAPTDLRRKPQAGGVLPPAQGPRARLCPGVAAQTPVFGSPFPGKRGAKTVPSEPDGGPSRLLEAVIEDSGSTRAPPQRHRPEKHLSRQREA